METEGFLSLSSPLPLAEAILNLFSELLSCQTNNFLIDFLCNTPSNSTVSFDFSYLSHLQLFLVTVITLLYIIHFVSGIDHQSDRDVCVSDTQCCGYMVKQGRKFFCFFVLFRSSWRIVLFKPFHRAQLNVVFPVQY